MQIRCLFSTPSVIFDDFPSIDLEEGHRFLKDMSNIEGSELFDAIGKVTFGHEFSGDETFVFVGKFGMGKEGTSRRNSKNF